MVHAPSPRRNDDAHSGSRIAAFPIAKFRNGERAELENLDLAACPYLFLDGLENGIHRLLRRADGKPRFHGNSLHQFRCLHHNSFG